MAYAYKTEDEMEISIKYGPKPEACPWRLIADHLQHRAPNSGYAYQLSRLASPSLVQGSLFKLTRIIDEIKHKNLPRTILPSRSYTLGSFLYGDFFIVFLLLRPV